MKFCLLLLNFFWILPLNLLAQKSGDLPTEKILELSFEEITVNDGLSQGMATSFVRDHSGFLWIGTKDGLNRFDGQEFKVLRTSETDPNSLPDNHVTCLFQDHNKMIWVGTIKNGITRYNPRTGKFLDFKTVQEINNRLNGKSIISISTDPFEQIWITTSEGFNYLTENSDKTNPDNDQYIVHPLNLEIPGAIANPFQIKFWKFLPNGNMEIYSENNIVTVENPTRPNSTKISAISIKSLINIDDPFVYPVFGTSQPITYYISANKLLVVDSESQKTISSFSIKTNLTTFPKPLMESNGNLWWKSANGLCLYDLATNKIFKIGASNPLIEQSRFNDFYSAFCDADGIMWFGTFGYGILKYAKNKNKFQVVSSFGDTKTSINGIYELSDNTILVQPYQFNDPVTLNLDNLTFNKSEISISKSEFNLRNNNSIVEDSSSIFISYKHLFKISKSGVTKFPLIIDSSAHFEIVYDPLFIDKEDQLWCANGYPSGVKELFHLNKNNGSVVYKYEFPYSDMHHDYRFVSAWLEDNKNNFWFGTLNGIYQFNKKSKKWRRFIINEKNRNSTNRDMVFSICFDPVYPDSILWIGTNGFGLKKLNMNDGSVKVYNTKSGLPNNVIYGILPDFKNNLWLSSNQGISLFIPSQDNIYNFGITDGLQSMEFNRYAYLKLRNGQILFGGVNGINIFDPKIFYNTKVKANTFITNLKIYNTSIEQGELFNNKLILEKPVEYTERIILPYDAEMITLTFAYLDMNAHEENQFQYKLEGLNDKWILSGNNNEATYTNLNPGEYVFKVIGRKKTAAWNSMPAVLRITVLPPWYSTLLFKLAILFGLISIIYIIYKYNINQTIKIHKIRNIIASDLHDDIGSTLSSISLSSAIIERKILNEPDEALTLVKQISNNTDAIMESMSDIVWTINTENDKFEEVINRMRVFTFEMLDQLNISIHFKVSENLADTYIYMEQRKNLYLIFKETINNLAKYAICKNVWISFSKTNHKLKMIIKDDGVGFEMAKYSNGNSSQSLGGNGLNNMNRRAKEIGGTLFVDSCIGSGTTITLEFYVS